MRTNWVMTLAAFAVACLLLAIAPGPPVAVVIRETLRSGRRHRLAAAAGTETGILGWSAQAPLDCLLRWPYPRSPTT